MNVLVIGQSNGVGWFLEDRQGARQFIATAAAAGVDVTLINACVSGSPLVPDLGGNCWSSDDSLLYQNAMTKVDGRAIDAVVWIQGEKEAVHGVSGEAVYAEGLRSLFDHLREDLGDVPIFMQALDGRGLETISLEAVQGAQLELAGEDAGVVLVENGQYLFRPDGTHFGPSDYRVLSDAMARQVLEHFGIEAPAPIAGSHGDDKIAGTAQGELLYGLGGDDVLAALGGRDALFGGRGGDRLLGGLGADTLTGGLGADTLRGSAGLDRLYGEAGADLFVLDLDAGVDVVEDFGERDRILVRGEPGELVFAGGVLYYAGEALAELPGVDELDLSAVRFG